MNSERKYEHTPRNCVGAISVLTEGTMLILVWGFSPRARNHAIREMKSMAVGDRFADLDNLDYWRRIA